MKMTKTPLWPFGMAVSDLDISNIAPPLFAELAELVAASRVVVFRHQTLNDAAFIRFLKGFGALTFTEGETPVEGAPDLNVVTNVGRLTPARSVFHTDTSYVPQPPAFTALRPVLLPSSGGDTLFSDQVGAAQRLPEKVRQFLAGRTLLHQATGLDGVNQSTRQPLFRRHPITGETSLYLSTPKRCSELSGVDAATSQRIIAALYWHSTRSARVYRHHWKVGDVLIWDNRVSMHKADHDKLSQDRVLHRGMVGGEVPLMAAARAMHAAAA
jgi:taurine dioxygenase